MQRNLYIRFINNLSPLTILLTAMFSLDDSRRIRDIIQKANGISELEIYQDVSHCWQMFDSMMPEARIALQKAVEFIGKYVSAD